jgi:hypothetical protein
MLLGQLFEEGQEDNLGRVFLTVWALAGIGLNTRTYYLTLDNGKLLNIGLFKRAISFAEAILTNKIELFDLSCF